VTVLRIVNETEKLAFAPTSEGKAIQEADVTRILISDWPKPPVAYLIFMVNSTGHKLTIEAAVRTSLQHANHKSKSGIKERDCYVFTNR